MLRRGGINPLLLLKYMNVFLYLFDFIFAGQSGSTSLKQSLSINKGIEDSPTIDASAQSIAHATHVPDATFNKREFAKSEGRPIIDGNSAAVAAALKAPKPPRTINSVDKTKVCS